MKKTTASTYEAALEALFSPLHNQVTTAEAMEAAQAQRHWTIHKMHVYAQRLRAAGIDILPKATAAEAAAQDSLQTIKEKSKKKIIHITGTKGKGSTACMCEVLCRTVYGQTTGLFTSPHLIDIRERIRINGKPVSKTVFGTAYWKIRTALEQNHPDKDDDDDDNDDDLPVLPGYFRMLTLMALYIFEYYQNPTVDVILLEVGMGGRYDATNLIDMDTRYPPRVVCGVTRIDYDHMRVLGNTLEQIAWEKGGIFKVHKLDNTKHVTPRPPSQQYHNDDNKNNNNNDDNENDAVASKDRTAKPRTFFALDSNIPSVLQVLRQCAQNEGQGGQLQLVGLDSSSLSTGLVGLLPKRLGLAGSHQRLNALLAIAMVQHLLGKPPATVQNTTWHEALANVSWPGRCQTISVSQNMTLCIDGAHTKESIRIGLEWFQSLIKDHDHGHGHDNNSGDDDTVPESKAATPTAVIGNQTRRSRTMCALLFFCSHEKNPVELLELLVHAATTTNLFDVVCFCRPNSERPSPMAPKTAMELLQETGRFPCDSTLPPLGDAATTSKLPLWQDTLKSIWKYLEWELQQQQQQQQLTTDSTNAKPWQQATAASVLDVPTALQYLQQQVDGCGLSNDTHMHVLVTGSLYLAGSALEAVQWKEPDAPGSLAQ